MEGERIVAGLACSEVLEELSDYLDGELTAERRESIERHLRGCDTCERFGREMAATVGALRVSLNAPEPLDHERESRLLERLRGQIRG